MTPSEATPVRRWPLFIGLAPAVLGCLSLYALWAKPAFKGSRSLQSPIVRSSLLAILGATALLALLLVIAARSRRCLPRWAYYMGGGLTCAVIYGLSRKPACFLFHGGGSGLRVADPFVSVATSFAVAVLTGAMSYLAFAAAVTTDLSAVGSPYSCRVSVRFGLAVGAVLTFAAIFDSCYRLVKYG